uniref:Reverse transcriptase domain-containing protein n=1 Tax=Tanacetum cinerariifolium TaxID=118510 RepID=A0A6L2LNP1_TANCI|nr:hypothetical protein [Tanacetum cinerariifolium]
MVYSIGLETRKRVCPHTREIQSIDHPTVAAGILKVTTRALALEEQSSLMRNIVTKECPHETRKRCQKVKAAQEDIESQDQRDKSRVWRMTSPNHGYESVDSYNDLRKAFLENYLQQKKDVKGASKCMKISGFMHGMTNPELIKRLHDNIPKSVDEMMRVTTTFLRGEVTASNRERKKLFPSCKQQEAGQKQNCKKGSFRNQQRTEQRQDKFTLLTKTPKEILALDKGKFKPPLSMTTTIEKRNASKFCRKAVTSSQRAEAKQCKRSRKGSQKGRNLRKGQATTDTVEDGTEGPIIIEAEMGGHCVHRMYVDGGSSSKILYEHCFNRFPSEVKNQMIPAATPLVGFSGEIIWPIGQISLLVKIGDEEHSTSAWMNFMVVRSPYPYNGIIERPRIRRIRAIPSTAHGMLKFPVIGGTVTLRSSKIIPLECTMVLGPGIPLPVIDQGDMTGVPLHIAEHKLNIREGCLPIRQKKRGQAPEINKANCEEVEKLVDADIMKEVHYHRWLSNPVIVKIHDDSWRICVDFKDLNNACPENGYPLPEIDWKVESLCGYPLKCFLDAYKGYHQIKMAEEDEEKTAFITSQGIFCYSKMSFGLKNAGATYQHLGDKHEIKPQKCAFGMREGAFLGYKVDANGLRVCPDKAEAILNLPSTKCLKDVQKLNGKLASLNRFLSKSAEESLSFFKTLKKCAKKSDFQWTAEAEMTFKQMKRLIAELPMLTATKEKEELIMYLAAAKEAISVLMMKRDGKQMPIYFVSHVLQGPKVNYTPMEKLILALVAGRLLKWRFELEEHDIHYRPKTSVKGQILADFITERPEDDTLDTPIEDPEELPDPFNATNKEAKYEALKAGLRIAEQMGVKNLQANVDSKLVANQEKSIDEKEILAVVEEEGHTKNTPIYEYLTEEILPEEKRKAKVIRRKAGRYAVSNRILYKKYFLGPWLRCVGPLQANYVLKEIHEGSCSMHARPRSVVAKVSRSGYYWLTMHSDARNLIRECSSCQVHRPVPRNTQ